MAEKARHRARLFSVAGEANEGLSGATESSYAMMNKVMMVGACALCLSTTGLAETLTAVGSDALHRAQAAGSVDPLESRAVEPKPPAAAPDEGEPAAEADGELLKIRSVEVSRGKGVSRALADMVRENVEAALSPEGEISSSALERRLLVVRQGLINRGYYFSRIVRVGEHGGVSPDGVLRLHLQAGFVRDIEVVFKGRQPGEDGAYFSNEQVLKRFDRVKQGDAFNYGELYLALYGLNNHPDLTADVNVGASLGTEADGDSSVSYRLDVEEQLPLHTSLEINNYAIDAVDNWQAVGTAQYLNLTRADDVLTVSPATALSGDQWSIAANYTRPFALFNGGSLSLYGGYSDSDIDDVDDAVISDLNYQGYGWFTGARVSFNLIDTPAQNLSLFFDLMFRSVEQRLFLDDLALQRYRVGVLPLTVGLSWTNRRLDALGGRNFASVSWTYNLTDTGDRVRDVWQDAETHYSILRAQFARIQPLFGEATLAQGFDAQWCAFLRLEGQWAGRNLMPYEQLSLGGHDNLRGYRTNGHYGDNGLYGTLELRTPVWRDLLSGTVRAPSEDPEQWIDSLQLLAFCDYGRIERESTRYSRSDRDFLWSLGFGARMALTRHTALTCDVAFPMRDLNENRKDDEDVEVYVGIRAQF